MEELYDTHRREDLPASLSRKAAALCEKIGFDRWKIVIFNGDRLCGTLLCSSDGSERDAPQAGADRFFFDRENQRSYLDLLLSTEKTVLNLRDSEAAGDESEKYEPLSPEARAELYFPLFLVGDHSREVAGCLYLARDSELRGAVEPLLADRCVVIPVADIQRAFELAYRKYMEREGLLGFVHLILEAAKARDLFEREHPCNVALLSALIGEELGFSAHQLSRLYYAALFHNIGRLLASPPEPREPGGEGPPPGEAGPAGDRHPLHGCDIATDLAIRYRDLAGIDRIILHQQERYDGSGYPQGLKHDDIPVESRILAIADFIDTRLSSRNCLGAKPAGGILRELAESRGRQFDPRLVKIAAGLLTGRPRTSELIPALPIITGTLELLSGERSCQLQGTLLRTGLERRFKMWHTECRCDRCALPLPAIVKAAFYTVVNGEIYEYEALIRYKDRRHILIARLTPRAASTYFSLSWELGGTLHLRGSRSSAVVITKIGGDFLRFHLPEKDICPENVFAGARAVTVNFESSAAIYVTGRVTKITRIDQKLYCSFKYLNLPEGTRDRIFEQIFEKETAFNRGLLAMD